MTHHNLPLCIALSLVLAPELAPAAFAQNDASSKPHPITSPIKDAGTYHLATGTWTRAKAPTANLGPDTIYNNTCLLYIYYGLSSLETMVDSGRLPSTNSGSVPGSVPGTSDVYGINGFLIAYCAFNAQVDLDVAHYECYSPASQSPNKVDVSKIYGRIQYVDAFADYTIEVVDSFPDLRVETVDAFADSAGEWEIVSAFPDFTIQKVDAFGDFKVEYVDNFPGPGCPESR